MSERRCDTCEWWEHTQLNTDRGFCYRYPPTVIAIENDIVWANPKTDDCDWCGEWKAKEEQKGGE